MLHGSTSGLNMLYIGDIHRAHSTDPFSCGQVEAGLNFFKMMAFFYAINRYDYYLNGSNTCIFLTVFRL